MSNESTKDDPVAGSSMPSEQSKASTDDNTNTQTATSSGPADQKKKEKKKKRPKKSYESKPKSKSDHSRQESQGVGSGTGYTREQAWEDLMGVNPDGEAAAAQRMRVSNYFTIMTPDNAASLPDEPELGFCETEGFTDMAVTARKRRAAVDRAAQTNDDSGEGQ